MSDTDILERLARLEARQDALEDFGREVAGALLRHKQGIETLDAAIARQHEAVKTILEAIGKPARARKARLN